MTRSTTDFFSPVLLNKAEKANKQSSSLQEKDNISGTSGEKNVILCCIDALSAFPSLTLRLETTAKVHYKTVSPLAWGTGRTLSSSRRRKTLVI